MDIRALLVRSFRQAKAALPVGASARDRNRARSRAWVEALADNLRCHYAQDRGIRVLSKHYACHRAEFGLNELLYDVLVCRVATVASAFHHKQLVYVHDVLWQIESEFARDSRQALFDFNKLVLGCAENKLFVGPHVANDEALLEVLLPVACVCTGKVYAALMAHPAEWTQDAAPISVWALREGAWQAV